MRMAHSLANSFVRHTIRWFFFGAAIFGIGTGFYGLAPIPYLMGCVAVGVLLFAIFASALRIRSGLLRISLPIFFIVAMDIVERCTGTREALEVIQGCSVAIAIWTGLTLVLRPWIYKFANLDPASPGIGRA